MGMYTGAILDAIAKNPGIRQVEIADKVDCDLEMVEVQIREELASGVIVREMVPGPNGRMQPSYQYDKAFQPELKPIVVEEKPAEKTVVAPAVPVDAPQKHLSKPKQAEIYLAKHGTATVEKMREVIDCAPRQHPNVYLSDVIGRGRIVFANGSYRLGTAQERVAARDQRQLEKPAAVPVPAPTPAAIPAPTPAPEIAKPKIEIPMINQEKAVEPEKQTSRFSCALWSDGELQLARNGKITETLNLVEVRELQRYLSRALATLPA